MDAHATLRRLFAAALGAADPFEAARAALPPRPAGRVAVVGAGKATARMAQAVEAAWGPLEGLIAVPAGAALPLRGIETAEASHPVPDARSEAAGRRVLALAESLGEGDLLLCLVSGGGSSLLAVPGGTLTLADKQAVGRALLASGAPISDMNAVRKHLSAIKGGRLAVAAWPARTLTLLVSDVPGDDPGTIASGPTVPERDAADARAILARHGIEPPGAVARHLASPAAWPPPSDHPAFAAARVEVVARPLAMLEAAAREAAALGLAPLVLGDAIEGEAAEAGRVVAGIARSAALHGHPVRGPAVLLSGGETTVTVRAAGGPDQPRRGGRNATFLLAFAVATWDAPLSAMACDTDGRDGSERNAGAVWLPEMRERATLAQARDHLARLDAYGFFESVGGLVDTGPTHTNVNDFRAVLIGTP